MDNGTTTEFRAAPGFPGYRVGDDGSVWSCWRRSAAGRATAPREMGAEWRRLVPLADKRNRLTVKLCRDHRVFRRFIHHLVLEAFVGPRPIGMEACHFPDRDTRNNTLVNLRWDTAVGNAADRVIHGTDSAGERNGRAKLSSEDVRRIRADVADGIPRKALAELHGVALSTIDMAVGRHTWRSV